ncbi:tellurium resistance protein TerW, partial [Escherichia coli]|nr:tellurium resistance protein TerW [Escherichia coli]
NTRQARIFKLANLLGTGKPVSAADKKKSLEISDPTIKKKNKELRESYSAEIKYSKAGHCYHLVNPGLSGI